MKIKKVFEHPAQNVGYTLIQIAAALLLTTGLAVSLFLFIRMAIKPEAMRAQEAAWAICQERGHINGEGHRYITDTTLVRDRDDYTLLMHVSETLRGPCLRCGQWSTEMTLFGVDTVWRREKGGQHE